MRYYAKMTDMIGDKNDGLSVETNQTGGEQLGEKIQSQEPNRQDESDLTLEERLERFGNAILAGLESGDLDFSDYAFVSQDTFFQRGAPEIVVSLARMMQALPLVSPISDHSVAELDSETRRINFRIYQLNTNDPRSILGQLVRYRDMYTKIFINSSRFLNSINGRPVTDQRRFYELICNRTSRNALASQLISDAIDTPASREVLQLILESLDQMSSEEAEIAIQTAIGLKENGIEVLKAFGMIGTNPEIDKFYGEVQDIGLPIFRFARGLEMKILSRYAWPTTSY